LNISETIQERHTTDHYLKVVCGMLNCAMPIYLQFYTPSVILVTVWQLV